MKKSFYSLLMISAVLCFSSTGYAQIIRSIVPVERNPQTAPNFYVQVSVDHADHIYRAGDNMVVTVTTNKNGFLYLIYKDAGGKTTLLYPNKFAQNNQIQANVTTKVPSPTMNFDLRTMAPFGKERLQAIVTLNPVDIGQAQAFQNGEIFKDLSDKTPDAIAKAMGVVERPGAASAEFAEFTTEITTVAAGTPAPTTDKKRVFIGVCIAKYEDKKIPALPACEKDIKALAKYFKENCGCDNNDSLLYINEQATLAKIRDLFTNKLPNSTKRGDEIIIYWTGHGNRVSDTNDDEKDGFDETLVLYDSKRTDPKTQLIDDEFGLLAQKLDGRKVLFLLDTCHSGGLGAHAKALNNAATEEWDFGFSECATMKDLGQHDLAMIASSAPDQVSMVRLDGKMSVMTYFVMQVLDKNRGVSHVNLYEKIKDDVNDFVKKEFNAPQRVFMQNEMDAPLILNP